jgi:hypothetical protein
MRENRYYIKKSWQRERKREDINILILITIIKTIFMKVAVIKLIHIKISLVDSLPLTGEGRVQCGF